MPTRFIGVTGTNGKTTTTYLVQSILREAGYRCAVIGTLSGKLTTPSPWHLKRLIRRYRSQHYDWVAMEVSSHGIHQNRIKGIPFSVKALTNITQDHLDYHKTMEEYRKVKLDWYHEGEGIRVSFWPEAHPQRSLNPKEGPRSFTDENRWLAAEICRKIGVSEECIAAGLEKAPQVPGRFEYVRCGQPFDIVIDFAHTPDGLEKVLQEAQRKIGNGRLIVVFGCGGDRDHGKRPLMGAIAVRYADVVIITSDNPRSEEPSSIIDDILAGIQTAQPHPPVAVLTIVDRGEAIEQALSMALPGDMVVLAGKGHERTQIFKDGPVPFNDKDEVMRFLTSTNRS